MIVSWNITKSCNLKCLHCCRDAGGVANKELSTGDGRRLLTALAEAGFKIVIFSGGEPLLREDIFLLIDYARTIGLRPVLGTNGTLITTIVAEKLLAAGLAVVGISIDSLTPAKHDYLRQVSGAWDQAMHGIAACREVGLPFQLHTTVTTWNEAEITDITDLAVQLGAIAHHIFFLVPTGRGKDLAPFALKTDQYEVLLNRILAKQSRVPIELKPTCAPQFMRLVHQRQMTIRYRRGCLAGKAYCVVLPNGDVQPCAYLPVVAGNVLDQDFITLWREGPIFKQLREARLRGACGRCLYTKVCGGCRARAYYAVGDYMAADPLCQ